MIRVLVHYCRCLFCHTLKLPSEEYHNIANDIIAQKNRCFVLFFVRPLVDFSNGGSVTSQTHCNKDSVRFQRIKSGLASVHAGSDSKMVPVDAVPVSVEMRSVPILVVPKISEKKKLQTLIL